LILLDTHALIWFANEDPLMPAELWHEINEEKQILVSAISGWEIAMLVEKERLLLNMPVDEWIKTAGSYFPLTWVDPDVDICLKSTQLPGNFHQDPADRLIAASTLLNQATLITKDKKLRSYAFLQTLWLDR
jgi:PIN domain nuclease of toxin-antitoxin system